MYVDLEISPVEQLIFKSDTRNWYFGWNKEKMMLDYKIDLFLDQKPEAKLIRQNSEYESCCQNRKSHFCVRTGIGLQAAFEPSLNQNWKKAFES